jgi:hypothetical protein
VTDCKNGSVKEGMIKFVSVLSTGWKGVRAVCLGKETRLFGAKPNLTGVSIGRKIASSVGKVQPNRNKKTIKRRRNLRRSIGSRSFYQNNVNRLITNLIIEHS